MTIIDVTVKAVVVIAWLLLCVWTLWKLNQLRKKDNLTYRQGVSGLGVMMWGTGTVVGALGIWETDRRHSVWYYGLGFAIYLLPICLWGGYLWGRIMTSIFSRR
jgi:hypothetical protein